MSALGHKQTCAVQKLMSALPPIADRRAPKSAGPNLPRVPEGISLTYALFSLRSGERISGSNEVLMSEFSVRYLW